MQYTNYAMKNNVFGTLSAPISSLATTIQLNTGQGQRFTADMLATLESMEGNKVTKREIVKITNVTGDTLTVIRKFAPCPSSDDANTQGQVSYSFSADDTISVYITKEHFDKIDGSINDLYDNGTNKLRTEVISGLQIKVNPGTVLVGSAYYDFAGDTITLTDNATNYVEIDEDGNLVSNTTAWGDKNTKIAIVTTSSGAVTNIEDRRLGTVGGKIGGVNIHDLTEKETLSPEDEFIVSDSENVRNNKKIKASNILGYNKCVCVENINKGDLVAIHGYNLQNGEGLLSEDIGQTNNKGKVAVKIYGSGKTSDTIYAYIGKVGNGQNLIVRVETDNNGEPSGTLVNQNATATILAGDLSSTLTNTKIILLGNVTTNIGEAYRVVFYTESIDNNNYCIIGYTNILYSISKIYNGNRVNNKQAGTIINNDNISYTGTNTMNFVSKRDLSFSVNKDIYIREISGLASTTTSYVNQIVIYENGVQIKTVSRTNYNIAFNVNLVFSAGNTYKLDMTLQGTYTYYTNCTYTAPDFITNITATQNPHQNAPMSFTYSTVDAYTESVSTELAYPIIKKIDTNIINTLSDIIGIALVNGGEGDYINIAINDGVATNDNRNLIPGKDYYYKDNTITDTYTWQATKICIGKAISKTQIKVDIKIFYYVSKVQEFILPFYCIVNTLPVSGNQSAGNVIVDGVTIGAISIPLAKGQKVNFNNANFKFSLIKNR